MFVGEVDDFFDSRLDDDFGALVTGEQSHILREMKF